jgi:hypothetical protein
MENLIQKYLSDNGLTGKNGYEYDFRVDENGNYYIDRWNYEIEKPSLESFENEQLAYLKEKKIEELKANTSKTIYNSYSAHKQSNIIGRINGYVDEDYNTMNTFITARIDDCRNIESLINACTTISEVEAIILT